MDFEVVDYELSSAVTKNTPADQHFARKKIRSLTVNPLETPKRNQSLLDSYLDFDNVRPSEGVLNLEHDFLSPRPVSPSLFYQRKKVRELDSDLIQENEALMHENSKLRSEVEAYERQIHSMRKELGLLASTREENLSLLQRIETLENGKTISHSRPLNSSFSSFDNKKRKVHSATLPRNLALKYFSPLDPAQQNHSQILNESFSSLQCSSVISAASFEREKKFSIEQELTMHAQLEQLEKKNKELERLKGDLLKIVEEGNKEKDEMKVMSSGENDVREIGRLVRNSGSNISYISESRVLESGDVTDMTKSVKELTRDLRIEGVSIADELQEYWRDDTQERPTHSFYSLEEKFQGNQTKNEDKQTDVALFTVTEWREKLEGALSLCCEGKKKIYELNETFTALESKERHLRVRRGEQLGRKLTVVNKETLSLLNILYDIQCNNAALERFILECQECWNRQNGEVHNTQSFKISPKPKKKKINIRLRRSYYGSGAINMQKSPPYILLSKFGPRDMQKHMCC